MGVIKTSRTLFFTTSPRSPTKLIPEIDLLIEHFSGKKWVGNNEAQRSFAAILAKSKTFQGSTSRKHTAFSARDRINRSPQGLGLVDLSPVVQLTDAGAAFTKGTRPQEVFFRQLMKFQIPSPYHVESQRVKGTFWGHPFLEITRLIREMDHITPDEFRVFALQLTDYRLFEAIKKKIIDFRRGKKSKPGRYKQYVDEVEKREIAAIYAKDISSGNTRVREQGERLGWPGLAGQETGLFKL